MSTLKNKLKIIGGCMSLLQSMNKRRSIYALGKFDKNTDNGSNYAEEIKKVQSLVEEVTELTPDAFNMKSAHVLIVDGKKHDELWDTIYEAFDGKVNREKIDMFKNAQGTILYFTDTEVVKGLEESYPLYAQNFSHWASQALGMLEHNVWTALAEHNIGANIQHYNPVIDLKVQELFNIPKTWKLDAQMPFGKILAPAEAKEKEDISKRVKFISE